MVLGAGLPGAADRTEAVEQAPGTSPVGEGAATQDLAAGARGERHAGVRGSRRRSRDPDGGVGRRGLSAHRGRQPEEDGGEEPRSGRCWHWRPGLLRTVEGCGRDIIPGSVPGQPPITAAGTPAWTGEFQRPTDPRGPSATLPPRGNPRWPAESRARVSRTLVPMSAAASYWTKSRAPRHSLTFALPLLLAYEALAFLLSGDAMAGVRNGADVLLKSVFTALGGRHGLAAFGLLLIGVGAVLVWRDRKAGPIESRLLALMLVESMVYAALLGGVASTLTGLVLGRGLAIGPMDQFGFPTQIMISLGAGLYEELVFRVLLVSGLAAVGRGLLGMKPGSSATVAIVAGALIFSGFHYLGPYGDPFEVDSFTFRAIAGLLFSGLYLARGFGIAAWSHALYDVFLAVVQR
ncbi:MAG: CPBP family intramembrane metalloprotease [Gemmatimonadetes bacterium]|nr:CPBP family intramembrane metalloprotease [Gemmatimonadota bacterium]